MTKKLFITLLASTLMFLAVAPIASYAQGKPAAAIQTPQVATEHTYGAELRQADIELPPMTIPPRLSKTFWALVPSVAAIVMALITKEVFSSLFLGIVLGGFLACDFRILRSVDTIVRRGFIPAIGGNSGIFVFLSVLGIIVALIAKSGASSAFGSWARHRVKGRKSAMMSTFGLCLCFFVDDYFNCLTSGGIMRPVTDAKRISRAKLSYIIASTAAPISIIVPISSWAAAVASCAKCPEYSGLELFIRSIPFNFYSLLTIIFVVTGILLGVDYGPMYKHEQKAMIGMATETDATGSDAAMPGARGRVLDLAVPVLILTACCVLSLLYSGGILDVGRTFSQALSSAEAATALPIGGMLALVATMAYFIVRRLVPFTEAMKCVSSGISSMIPAIVVLSLATTLKNMTGLMDAQAFIVDTMNGFAGGLSNFMPCVIFAVSAMLAFSTGTSWGTFGILIPIVLGIFEPSDPLLFIGMSACLAGAVCGDHCSPISDTAIMSAAGAGCELMEYVSAQLPYGITVAVISFIGFIMAGWIRSWFIVFPAMTAITIGVLVCVKLMEIRQAKKI
ncbi:MAG: hypothetical protein MJ025_04970 [Victivallaceae bacterium]|nr:hypothetical protein [Victivallaceae bacterium]